MTEVKRLADGRFEKGTPCPHPGGRPTGINDLLRKLAGENLETYIRKLHDIATGKIKAPVSVQYDAVTWLLERYYGKTPQPTINLNLNGGGNAALLSDAEGRELAARLTEIEARLALPGGAGDLREQGTVAALPAPGGRQPEAP